MNISNWRKVSESEKKKIKNDFSGSKSNRTIERKLFRIFGGGGQRFRVAPSAHSGENVKQSDRKKIFNEQKKVR